MLLICDGFLVGSQATAAAIVAAAGMKRTIIEASGNGPQVVFDDAEGSAFWEQHPPFGGASRTGAGWGRIGGKYTILDMTDLRTAIIDTGRSR